MNYFSFGKRPKAGPCLSVLQKIMLTMKITFFMLLVLVTTVHAEGMAQKVTLSLKNENIERVFTEITRQTSIEFLYSDELVEKAKPISIQVKDADINDVLKQIMAKQRMTYKVIESTVIVNLLPTNFVEPKESIPVSIVQQDIHITGKISDIEG